MLAEAAAENDWSKVEPGIFGTLFQGSMEEAARHALGAHFTNEAEIQRVVLPTIVRPWQQRIKDANTLKQLLALRKELLTFRVLESRVRERKLPVPGLSGAQARRAQPRREDPHRVRREVRAEGERA